MLSISDSRGSDCIRDLRVLSLHRQYAFPPDEKYDCFRPRRRRERVRDFKGTDIYASLASHHNVELVSPFPVPISNLSVKGRKDDLISLLYLFIDLVVGLPWEVYTQEQVEQIRMAKERTPFRLLVKHLPNPSNSLSCSL